MSLIFLHFSWSTTPVLYSTPVRPFSEELADLQNIRKFTQKERPLSLAGIRDGTLLRLRGRGKNQGGKAGDLYLKIRLT